MQKNIIWEGLDADTTENCAVNYLVGGGIVVRSEISGWINKKALTVEYIIKLDNKWHVLEFELTAQIGNKPANHYAMSNKQGLWTDNSGKEYTEFKGCDYIDITLTPFTNSLPINGLLFSEGERHQIDVIYIDVMDNDMRKDRQRYTKLNNFKYRFENDFADQPFTADIDVDENGFVTFYPELFETI